MTIINITEKNNILDFTSTYTPIVCGNSSYCLNFTFGSIWQKCTSKIAVFVVDGRRMNIAFEGNSVKVPAMPNAECMFVSVVSGDGEEKLTTTALKVRLVPTSANNTCAEFEQISGCVADVLGAINKIKDGDIVANKSLLCNQVSNPNYLINADFKVNQRGSTSYSGMTKYTVDRWKTDALNSKVEVCEDGVVVGIYGTTTNSARRCFVQDVEDYQKFKGKTVCFSVEYSDLVQDVEDSVSIKIHDGVSDKSSKVLKVEGGIAFVTKTIDKNATKLSVRISAYNNSAKNYSVKIKWAKLELGEVPTTFVPRLYAEELTLCQRYYQIYKKTSAHIGNPCYIGTFWAASDGGGYMLIDLVSPMRVYPTLKTITITYKVGTIDSSTFNSVLGASGDTFNSKLKLFGTGSFTSLYSYPVCVYGNDNYLELDAEIY